MGPHKARRAGHWVPVLLLLLALISCTEEANERPVFNGPDRLPGLRVGGAQDVAGFDHAVTSRMPLPSEFQLAGWINNQTTHLPAPESTHDLTVHGLVALESTSGGTTGIVQIGIGSEHLLPVASDKGADGSHIGLVIAVDESGSMASGGKNRTLRFGLDNLFLSLPPGIHLGLVGFSGQARTIWPAQAYEPATQLDALLAAKATIHASGGTNMHAGLERALQMAEAMPADLTYRYVILVTDGRPSRGLVEHGHFRSLIDPKNRKRTVGISTIGIGDAFDVELLEILSGEQNPTWMMNAPSNLEWSLTDAYRTIGSPQARGLTMEVELAQGWTVIDAPGLKWEDASNAKTQRISIRGPLVRSTARRVADDQAVQPACDAGSDAGADAAADVGSSAEDAPAPETAAFNRHLAVDHPGVVLLRVATPAPLSEAELANLEIGLARIRYQPVVPAIARVGGTATQISQVAERTLRTGTVCKVTGTTLGMSSPIARRTLALLRVGEAIEQSLATWQTSFEQECDEVSVGMTLTLRTAALAHAQTASDTLASYCVAVGLSKECNASGGVADDADEPCASGASPAGDLSDAAQRLQLLIDAMKKAEPELAKSK